MKFKERRLLIKSLEAQIQLLKSQKVTLFIREDREHTDVDNLIDVADIVMVDGEIIKNRYGSVESALQHKHIKIDYI